MSDQVRIELRAARPYAGIPVRVTMDGLSGAVDKAFPELFGWLAAQDIPAAGPPFIRYLVIDMAAELQIEFAVPVAVDISGSERIQPGVLPASLSIAKPTPAGTPRRTLSMSDLPIAFSSPKIFFAPA